MPSGFFQWTSKVLHPAYSGRSESQDGEARHRGDLDELLGISTASLDFDLSSVEGEAQLQAYMQVQQVPNDTDPLMWWKQH